MSVCVKPCCVCLTANQEYYHQWSVEESHGCSLDLSAFTIEELDNITSEYTLKNTVSTPLYTLKHTVSSPLSPPSTPSKTRSLQSKGGHCIYRFL